MLRIAPLLLLFVSYLSFAQPAGFVDEKLTDQFNNPTGLTFDKTGRLYAWEKGGYVYKVDKQSGQKELLLDISEEVYDYLDHGLNGLTFHPNFVDSGFVYLLYTVDRNYLYYKDSSFYSTDNNDKLAATIARVTRYTLANGSIDPQSRKIILGEKHTNAIPILMDNHGIGSLVFGSDGSLFVSVGDGAIAKNPPFNANDQFYYELATLPIEEGIITADQNIGPYRAQYLNSLNGKLLRIDPETGEGYPSNPFYDSENPAAPRSRIWSYGLRNPFRFSLKPQTGTSDPAEGNPGTFYVGDVGWSNREEINVIEEGGLNYGWPYYEGILHRNTLFDDPAYFPESFEPPLVEWRGDIAQALIDGEAYGAGSPEFAGESFTGNGSIGGLELTTDHFTGYKGTYIQGDYQGWIKIFKFDFRGFPYEVVSIQNNVHPTCFAEDPTDGSIYYVNLFYPNVHEIRHLYNEPNPNYPPEIQAKVEPFFGNSPLTVNLDATGTTDPEGGPLTFQWNYGNGLTNDFLLGQTNYISDKTSTFTPILTVKDQAGKTSVRSFKVYVNNFPPEIKSTSIDNIKTFINEDGLKLNLSAVVDNHDPNEQLFYEWSIVLHHEDHTHLISSLKTAQAEATLAPIPCDDQFYYYEIRLFVQDIEGLGTTFTHNIQPLCEDDIPVLGLTLSPNPVKWHINLKGRDDLEETQSHAYLFDIHGRLLFEQEGYWKVVKNDLNKTLRRFSAGSYILKLDLQDGSQSFRFVKD